MDNSETTLYRFLDKCGKLLYVGVARDAAARQAQHMCSPWGKEIASMTVEQFSDRHKALAAERDVIVLEKPLWNKTHSRRHNDAIETSSQRTLTSKQQWEQWNRDYSMKHWFSFAYVVKDDDGTSMELPIFSMKQWQPDMSVWSWQSKNGSRSVEFIPGANGRATLDDKDVLIYLISKMINKINSGQPKSENRVIRFNVHNYLMSTRKTAGPSEHKRMKKSLDRLCEARIKTDICEGGNRIQEDCGIIENWHIVDKSLEKGFAITVEIILSKWLFNVVQTHEVFEINRDYFCMRDPIARRIYELARENCQSQVTWNIDKNMLFEKIGGKIELTDFFRCLTSIYQSGCLPDYWLKLDTTSDRVRIYQKERKKNCDRYRESPLPNDSIA